jgi:hypothetical protein
VINELGSALFSVANISTTGAVTYITSNATQQLNASTTLYQADASSNSLLIYASQTLTCSASQIGTLGQEITVAQWAGTNTDTVTRLSTNANLTVNLGSNTDANLSNITVNSVRYVLSQDMTGTHNLLNSSRQITFDLSNFIYTLASDVVMCNQLRNDTGTNSNLAKLNVYTEGTGVYVFFDDADTNEDRTKPLTLAQSVIKANQSTVAGAQGFGYTTTAQFNSDNTRTAGGLVRRTGVYTSVPGISSAINNGSGVVTQYQIITIRDDSMENVAKTADATKTGSFFQLFAYTPSIVQYE